MAVATVLANAAHTMVQEPQSCLLDIECYYECEDGDSSCHWSRFPTSNTKNGKCGITERHGQRECYLPCDSNSACSFSEYWNTSKKKCVVKDHNGAKCSEDSTCASNFYLNGECSSTAGKKSCTKTDGCTGVGEDDRICSPETKTCLKSRIGPGNQCQITEQCDQGFSYRACCQSGRCGACIGMTGATCSEDLESAIPDWSVYIVMSGSRGNIAHRLMGWSRVFARAIKIAKIIVLVTRLRMTPGNCATTGMVCWTRLVMLKAARWRINVTRR